MAEKNDIEKMKQKVILGGCAIACALTGFIGYNVGRSVDSNLEAKVNNNNVSIKESSDLYNYALNKYGDLNSDGKISTYENMRFDAELMKGFDLDYTLYLRNSNKKSYTPADLTDLLTDYLSKK